LLRAKSHLPPRQPQVQKLEIKPKQNAENFAFGEAEFSREIGSDADNLKLMRSGGEVLNATVNKSLARSHVYNTAKKNGRFAVLNLNKAPRVQKMEIDIRPQEYDNRTRNFRDSGKYRFRTKAKFSEIQG